MKVNRKVFEFEWDKGNIGKNQKHRVEDKEAEESFLDKKKKIFKDILHSGREKRHRVVGKTKKVRLLFIAFTIRNKKIRIISARDINKKEVYLYEKAT
jgi:uncharacterized DUF497 family protein